MNGSQQRFFVRALTCAVIFFNVSGNYFLDVGIRSMGEIVSLSPLDYLKVFTNVWAVVGIALLLAWIILQLSLLSWADLTYVLPITATSYILLTILGALFLNNHVTASRWAGVCLIVIGVMVVGRTRPRTAPGDHEENQ
jgi:uncharacterized membrane protein